MARDCSVSRTTVEGYIGILEDLLIAVKIPVFARRSKRELVSHGKFYFFDTGVWRAIRPKGPLDMPMEIDGAALEGLVFQHLRASLDLEGERDGLYFWRTRGGLEVDFVLYAGNRFWAIEVKNATRIHPSDLRGLCAFREDYPEATPILLYRGRERIVQSGITLVPVGEFLSSL